MRILIILITTLGLILPAYADVAVDDLPYLEGTPLEQTSEDSTWTLLDYEQADDGFAWAWLENAGHLAYVVYPSSSEVVVFPDGTSVDSNPENVVLQFLGDADQQLVFTRLGGSVVLEGGDISMIYTAAPIDLSEGINVELISSGSIRITGSLVATTLTLKAGETISNEGTISTDTLAWVSGSETSPDILTPNPNCLKDNGVTISSIGAEDISYKTPCSGDFLISSESLSLEGLLPPLNSDQIILITEENIIDGEAAPTESKQTQSAQQKKSSGGNTSGLILGLLGLLALFRRKNF